jgi:hypothetical protein
MEGRGRGKGRGRVEFPKKHKFTITDASEPMGLKYGNLPVSRVI